ncbi:MAG: hypothetical protein GY805_38300 [Chloroflexi bacterium]|nr:hypothetical protein [Chloroflexota bacterium]
METAVYHLNNHSQANGLPSWRRGGAFPFQPHITQTFVENGRLQFK